MIGLRDLAIVKKAPLDGEWRLQLGVIASTPQAMTTTERMMRRLAFGAGR